MTVPLNVLDLVLVQEGATPREALRNSLELAQHAERCGYRRYWIAEHHNMRGIAGGATSVVIGHIAAGTSEIRVGAGGIMLPNHAPYVIAEQFGTLASLHPGRIDLGLGRAPGSDQIAFRAMRRDPASSDMFPQDVQELQALLGPSEEGQRLIAVPGEGTEVPLWILGSSTFGARLAGLLGLPYAFASHFAPDALHAALNMYRESFQPSAQLDAPYAMAAVNVICADTDAEARRLFTTPQQSFTNLVRGTPGRLPAPIDDIEAYWSPVEKAHAMRMLQRSLVGTPDRVAEGLDAFVQETGVDEVIVAAAIYDPAARRRSYGLLAEAAGLPARTAAPEPATAAVP